MVRSQRHQVSFGLGAVLGGDSEVAGLGEPVEGVGDRPGLGDVDVAVVHRLGELVVSLDGAGEVEVGADGSAYLLGLDGEPVGGAARGFGVGGAGPVGLGEDPELQGGQL